MYVSFDHVTGQLLHKHAEFDVLCDLDYLAGRGEHTSVFPITQRDAFLYMPQEVLKKLYLTHNPVPPCPFGVALSNACMRLADAMQPTACDPVSVVARANALAGSKARPPRVTATAAAVATPGSSRVDRATIFKVADGMWLDEGGTTSLEGLLKLRKAIMDKLESEYGCKRTTASTALGEWQKGKLI